MMDCMQTLANERQTVLSSEPFTLTNISRMIEQVERWRSWFGFIEPYYALKAQNTQVTRKLFGRLGCGYDCASLPEIAGVLAGGCSPENIVVAHPFKSHQCIVEILERQMLTVVDSVQEVKKISRIQKDRVNIKSDDMPSTLIRIKASESTSRKVEWDLSTKFGVKWEEFETLVGSCVKNEINVKGIAFHVGLRASDAEPWIDTIAFARECWDILHKYGYSPGILDIGGGFYQHDDNDKRSEEIGRRIQECIVDNFSNLDRFPTTIAEPGS